MKDTLLYRGVFFSVPGFLVAQAQSSSPCCIHQTYPPVLCCGSFAVLTDFKSRFIKVKISQMVHKETEDEAKETRSKVDEDRKWQYAPPPPPGATGLPH